MLDLLSCKDPKRLYINCVVCTYILRQKSANVNRYMFYFFLYVIKRFYLLLRNTSSKFDTLSGTYISVKPTPMNTYSNNRPSRWLLSVFCYFYLIIRHFSFKNYFTFYIKKKYSICCNFLFECFMLKKRAFISIPMK